MLTTLEKLRFKTFPDQFACGHA